MTTNLTTIPHFKVVIYSVHKEEVYSRCLAFVDALEPDPRFSRLSRHYRNRAGELLGTLDQVINAIIDDELMTEEEPVLLAA